MNIILFDRGEIEQPIPFEDWRMNHIQEILKLKEGHQFEAGIVGGEIGQGVLSKRSAEGWHIRFTPQIPDKEPSPITLLIGCPRPPVARRLVKDLCTMGVRKIIFCATDLGEKSYLDAKIWHPKSLAQTLMEGAMQGRSTFLPPVSRFPSLSSAIKDLGESIQNTTCLINLDMKEHRPTLIKVIEGSTKTDSTILAVGPERGWSPQELKTLLDNGFIHARLTDRILRTETASIAGAAILLSR